VPQYERMLSPVAKPQSYGAREKMTPDDEKIKWEFNMKINESK